MTEQTDSPFNPSSLIDPLDNNLFSRGTITTVLDAQAGSSAKGLVSAWLTKNFRPEVLMTANGRNSSHTVVDSGRKLVFKVLPVGVFYAGHHDPSYNPIVYIGPGAAFMAKDLLSEIEMVGIRPSSVFVHPNASIVTQDDVDYENGLKTWEGEDRPCVDHQGGTTAHGTTGSGSGAARAKKSLRKGLIARDCPELASFIYRNDWLPDHIEEKGYRCLMDGSQGYWLSLYSHFYPNVTSRSTTLASFFSECDMPLRLAGNVCSVARTFPIRINSKRYFLRSENRFLTHGEALMLASKGIEPEEVDSFSGGWYEDQEELTWRDISEIAGYQVQPELTSLTKLERRIARWSDEGFKEFLRHNRAPRGFCTNLFVTFLNYLGKEPAQLEFLQSIRNNFPQVDMIYGSDSAETDSASAICV